MLLVVLFMQVWVLTLSLFLSLFSEVLPPDSCSCFLIPFSQHITHFCKMETIHTFFLDAMQITQVFLEYRVSYWFTTGEKQFVSQKNLDSIIKKVQPSHFYVLVECIWCSVLVSAANVAQSRSLNNIYDKSLHCTSSGTSCSLFLGSYCLITEDHTSQNYRINFF